MITLKILLQLLTRVEMTSSKVEISKLEIISKLEMTSSKLETMMSSKLEMTSPIYVKITRKQYNDSLLSRSTLVLTTVPKGRVIVSR